METIYQEGMEEYQDGVDEYYEKKAEVEQELADAHQVPLRIDIYRYVISLSICIYIDG